MPRTREEILEDRRRLKAQFGDLFDATSALLFRHDPAGINFEVNTDDYEPEVGTILPRLSSCQSEGAVLLVLHDEFLHWFGPETAESPERYRELASEIWQLWQRHLDDRKTAP